MADLTFPIFPISPHSGVHGFPTFPTPPLGGMGNGKDNGANERIEFQLLLKAAMRACDHHGDGPEARAVMSRDCLATPKHLRADLLDHFLQAYPEDSIGSLAETQGGGNSNRPALLAHTKFFW